jgi:hypothetical protein
MPTNNTDNPELALRYNQDKLNWSLVDFESLEPMVKVLEFGAKKYSPNNWKKGLPYSSTLNSLLRHVFCLMKGEELDKESGLPHIGHIQCNAMFLAHAMKNHVNLDDLNLFKKQIYDLEESINQQTNENNQEEKSNTMSTWQSSTGYGNIITFHPS